MIKNKINHMKKLALLVFSCLSGCARNEGEMHEWVARAAWQLSYGEILARCGEFISYHFDMAAATAPFCFVFCLKIDAWITNTVCELQNRNIFTWKFRLFEIIWTSIRIKSNSTKMSAIPRKVFIQVDTSDEQVLRSIPIFTFVRLMFLVPQTVRSFCAYYFVINLWSKIDWNHSQEAIKNNRKSLKVLQKEATNKENLIGRSFLPEKCPFKKSKS